MRDIYLRSSIGQGKLRSYLEPVQFRQHCRIRGRVAVYPEVHNNEPPGAVGGRYGSGCFHFSSRFSVSLISSYQARQRSPQSPLRACVKISRRDCCASVMGRRTLRCRGSVTFLFASKSSRIYSACPRQRYRCTLQSRASLRDRL